MSVLFTAPRGACGREALHIRVGLCVARPKEDGHMPEPQIVGRAMVRYPRSFFIHTPDNGYWSGSYLNTLMKTKFSLWGIAVGLSLMLPFITSCGDSDDGPDGDGGGSKGSKSGEWYTTGFATSSDFREINQAIDDHELLASYSRPSKVEYYAEPDFFFNSEGWFSTSSPNFGRLRFKPDAQTANVLRILKDNTAEFYLVMLYRANDVPGPKFCTVNAGNLGKLCYSTDDTPSIYTYVEYEGKYVFSNGDIYIKRGNDLYPSGSSTPLKRFTPESL